MKLSTLSKTPTIDETGVWFDYAEGVRFKVRPAGCKAFTEFIRRRAKTLPGGLESVSDDPKVAEDLQYAATANAILVDWEGVTNENGDHIPYNADEAEAAMRENHRFFTDISEMSRKVQKNIHEYEERVSGKS